MSEVRIGLVAAAILGLTACAGSSDIQPPSQPPPPEPPAAIAFSMTQPSVRPATPKPVQPPPAAAPQAAKKVAPAVAVKPPTPIAPVLAPGLPPAAALTLDLNALKKQLKDTKAIGLFSKLALKNQVDDLLERFGKYYQGKSKTTMADLRQSYNLLMMKVLSLLKDEDQKLSSAIVSSREAIWDLLADPKKFAALDI